MLTDMPEKRHDISAKNFEAAKGELTIILGEGGINYRKGDLIAHSSTAWSEMPNPDAHAALIVYPTSTEDVSKIARICHRRHIPMTPFSGGTSLEGALAATRGGICIDFSRMNKVIALHGRDMDVVAQPGVDWQILNEELSKHDLFFPVDPGPGACIGGMVGTNCSGTNAYRYGAMREWVINLTLVLADGTVVKTRHRPRKSSAGYDLARLIVGASGTLGIVTEVTLKVTSKPRNVRVATAAFPTTQKAVDTAVQLVQNEVQCAAIEMLDEVYMYAINQAGNTDRTWKETPTIFFKFSGPTMSGVKEQIDLVKKYAKENGALNFDLGATEEAAEELWHARKTALWSFLALKEQPDHQFVSSDVAVPISRLADIIEDTKAKLVASGLKGSVLGHLGDGNFHAAILHSAEDKSVAERIIKEIQQVGVEYEGTVSGEHGIGLTFRDALENELGEDTIAMMRRIKMALDPLCLLNCDKVFYMDEKNRRKGNKDTEIKSTQQTTKGNNG